MSKFRRFILALIGQYYPEFISKRWDDYLNNRKGDWGFFYLVNRKGNPILIDKEIFNKLIISGYYEQDDFHSGYIRYKLIKK